MGRRCEWPAETHESYQLGAWSGYRLPLGWEHL